MMVLGHVTSKAGKVMKDIAASNLPCLEPLILGETNRPFVSTLK